MILYLSYGGNELYLEHLKSVTILWIKNMNYIIMTKQKKG